MQNSFGEFLKQKRIEKGLTQKQLAQELFVSESAISKWEKNVARPDITLLPNLSKLLGVTEHELITASVDEQAKVERSQAKKWRSFTTTWCWFFYIAYAITILTCFICNLAVNKTLSWFFIVLSALILAFTFTNLPKLIKKHKLIFLPLFSYLSLCLLLGVCCIYSGGNWFLIPVFSVLLGLLIIFVPIYISKYKVFSKIKRHNDFISVAIDFVFLNILLVVINAYTVTNNNTQWWYLSIALPIVLAVYLLLNILIAVKFLRTNKLIKTSIILTIINLFIYLPPIFINVKNPAIQEEINGFNVLKANFSVWQGAIIENNVNLIVALTLILLSLTFLACGLVKHLKNKK